MDDVLDRVINIQENCISNIALSFFFTHVLFFNGGLKV